MLLPTYCGIRASESTLSYEEHCRRAGVAPIDWSAALEGASAPFPALSRQGEIGLALHAAVTHKEAYDEMCDLIGRKRVWGVMISGAIFVLLFNILQLCFFLHKYNYILSYKLHVRICWLCCLLFLLYLLFLAQTDRVTKS
jgi:hypothetical protein